MLSLTHPQRRNLVNIADFITELYCKIDDALPMLLSTPRVLSISELSPSVCSMP